MTKIIGISGAHCTGKSSTLDAIAVKQSRDPYIIVDDYKASRSTLKEFKCTLEQVTSNAELMQQFQRHMLSNKLHRDLFTLRNSLHSSAKANFLVDRSPADLYAYASLWADQAPSSEIDVAFLPSYATTCFDAIQSYDAIIYFPIGKFEFVDDGVRAKLDTQAGIDTLIKAFFKIANRPAYEVTSTTVEDRADEIIEFVRFLNR